MTSLVLADLDIIIGLDWTLHENLNQAKRALPRDKTPSYVRKIVARECVQGLAGTQIQYVQGNAGGKRRSRKNPMAGALVVAGVVQNAIVFEKVDENLIWVCAVVDGLPVTGGDVIQTEDSARATYAELLSHIPDATLVGNIEGAAISLEDVISQAKPDLRRRSRIIKPGQTTGRIIRVLGIAVMIVGGWQAWEMFKPVPPPPPPPPVIIPPAPPPPPPPPPPDMSAIRAQEAFELEVAKAREELFYAVSPAAQFSQWRDVMRSIPPSVMGWQLSGISCDTEKCRATWRRNPAALVSTVNYLPGEVRSTSLDMADSTFNLVPLPKVKHPADPTLTTMQHQLADIATRMPQGLNLTTQAVRDELHIVPKKGVNKDKPVVIGKLGEWTMRGQNALFIESKLNEMALPGVVLTEMQVQGSIREGSMSLKGKYHVPVAAE